MSEAPAFPSSTFDPTDPAAAERPHSAWRGVLAAIDIGSNSFRLELGQIQRGQYRRLDYLKETVRLGAGLDEDQRLTPAASARALACLQRFRARLAGIAPENVRAVATQTLREAVNRNEFLAVAQETLGHPVEVISGREEARLIYKGVARLQPAEHRRLVIDIGGRSTEMILGEGSVPLQVESFQIGSVSLSTRYFGDGRYTEAAFRDARIAAGAELEEAIATFGHADFKEALGSSGTAGAVSGLLAANGISDGSITAEGLRWCIDACLRAGHQDALQLSGLKPERRAVLGGGLAILDTLITQFGIQAIKPTRGALRQGVIFDLEERLLAARSADPHDRRDDGARELQLRFGVDRRQADRVQAMALGLFDDLSHADPALALGDARRELGWAAALHEVGMMVSHHDHHRHSAYLVRHADLDGFSQSQLQQLAALVLGQRGGLRKLDGVLPLAGPAPLPTAAASLSSSHAALASLPLKPRGATPGSATTPWQSSAQLLSLRLAVILCHARADVPSPVGRLLLSAAMPAVATTNGSPGRSSNGKRPNAARGDGLSTGHVQLRLSEGWAPDHPRTLHLLREEVEVWAKVDSLRLVLAG